MIKNDPPFRLDVVWLTFFKSRVHTSDSFWVDSPN